MISTGNQVKFTHFVLLAISNCCDIFFFFFVQCIIKQLLDLVFLISRIIKVSVKVISQRLQLRLITPTSTLIILDVSKTSSNNIVYPFFELVTRTKRVKVYNLFYSKYICFSMAYFFFSFSGKMV